MTDTRLGAIRGGWLLIRAGKSSPALIDAMERDHLGVIEAYRTLEAQIDSLVESLQVGTSNVQSNVVPIASRKAPVT